MIFRSYHSANFDIAVCEGTARICYVLIPEGHFGDGSRDAFLTDRAKIQQSSCIFSGRRVIFGFFWLFFFISFIISVENRYVLNANIFVKGVFYSNCVVKSHYFDRFVAPDFKIWAEHFLAGINEPAFLHHSAGSRIFREEISP